MFETLTSSFNRIFSGIIGTGKSITDADLDKAIKDIRLALLDADVNIEIAKKFIDSIRTKIVGQDVLKTVSPGQMIVKIIQDEISDLLGKEYRGIDFSSGKTKIILMVGLQGAGKTTSSAKLASKLKKSGAKVLMASLDVRRPAAQEQLKILGEKIEVDTLQIVGGQEVLEIVNRAIKTAESNEYHILILDTAGRQQIDDELMAELQDVRKISNPSEILLTLDAMVGRESLNVGRVFNEELGGITGVVLTRIDGDPRGGVALNIRMDIGCQIKYLGTGEKIEDFEEFHPERIASRILDMGDIVSMVEKAEEALDKEELENIKDRFATGQVDFNDILKQIRGVKKMGGVMSLVSLLPGATKIKDAIKEKQFDLLRQEAIILSMTNKERKNPHLFERQPSRKMRVANGSGAKLIDINKLLKQLKQVSGVSKAMKRVGGVDALKNLSEEDIIKFLKK